MPSSSLAEYLAKNYLTADPSTERPKKKRKKTKALDTAGDGLIIADDDPPDLRTSATNFGNEDDEGPSLVTSARSAEFRRTKQSNWKTLGGPANANANDERDAADAILASAAAESAARRGEGGEGDDEAPAVVEDADDEAGLRMESGARAGLQTAEQTAAMVAAQERRKKAEAARHRERPAEAQETIYRDASGRIINVAMKRAEARRAEQEKREKEEAAKEALMGDVQRAEREARRQQIQEARAMPLARTIEDDTLNEELKAQQRWNDPAAGFLTKTKGPGASVTGKPLYKGAFQPNRYGIRPGHRWDGVDRGNGFEKEWFTARNKKGRLEALDYQWQMDE
ncbi:putative cell cycle control protein (Cwf26) [Aspergillus thermomutatus]|uniref:Pre-mRNA-splicing factor cwc26 n=1 Tax=Aspergillus thermomutatus TaxID=41047 RepID=A0A397GZN1_ASPTH|nr:Pre-mRNA-splicing factor cwc26 [Aspergillus thermomutatus]RHZ56411.1 Pre-mRNA-splicing factor cwc26 [Aspergillus thermomutatus]